MDDVVAILEALDVNIISISENEVYSLCPVHSNQTDPVFATNLHTGLCYCHNPACGYRGTIKQLVADLTGKGPVGVAKFLHEHRRETDNRMAILQAFEDYKAPTPYSQIKLDRFYWQFWETPEAVEYMHRRGFTDKTLRDFFIGSERGFVNVPMHDILGTPVGVIGRSILNKQFNNTPGLPKRHTLWNIHRAKGTGRTVVVTEASFDAMRVHQASGYPVVATLGNVTNDQIKQMHKYFSSAIIMTDNDAPGVSIGKKIAKEMPVKWGNYSYLTRFPHDAKDCGEMLDQEIKTCIQNAITDFEFDEQCAILEERKTQK